MGAVKLLGKGMWPGGSDEIMFSYILCETVRFHGAPIEQKPQGVQDVEVDLVVERPGKKLLCIEIKSFDAIKDTDISSFGKITKNIEECEAIVLSQDRFAKQFDHVTCYPWKQGLVDSTL